MAVLERELTTGLRVLTPAQKAQFERDGFYIARGLFSQEEVTEIRETFMEMAEQGPVEGLFEPKRGDVTFAASDPLSRYPRAMHPHRQTRLPVGVLSERYMLDSRYHEILADLFGEEPLAAQSMFYFKPAGARGQALHQDNFYLRVAPGTCMAAWLSVDDADEENGTLMVVPGSHKGDVACPQKADPTVSFTSEFVPVPQGLEEVPVNLKAGDVLFFNGSLIHGSYPNTSKDRFRRSFICHYVPESCTEVGQWYELRDFSGVEAVRADAQGAGLCGTEYAVAGPH